MIDDGYDGDVVEDLPDVSGLTPLRSLDELRQEVPRVPSGPPPRRRPEEALREGWGYDAFRPLQGEAVAAGIAGRDCLVVLPTGGGKSLCFQVPPACGHGLTVVVSPLISLMDDQVAGAREAGLRAAAIHSMHAPAVNDAARIDLQAGDLDLLYCSPERLVNGDLLAVLTAQARLVAIDEAHCISHWGHDFRPEYRQLAAICRRFEHGARMALTATATPQVQDDIVAQLGLRDPLRLVGHVDRPNLVYRVLRRQRPIEQIAAVARRHPGEGGIVYCLTRKRVMETVAGLSDQGITCLPYHAGLERDQRRQAQEAFTAERVPVIVATVAFGMGIDRSNVRWVVHSGAPRSIEHYQQESGRAGRDGEPAECTLLWSGDDFRLHRFLATRDEDGGGVDAARLEDCNRQLRGIARYLSSPLCRHRLLAEYFGQVWPPPDHPTVAENCRACDVCLGEVAALDAETALTTAQKILSALWRIRWPCGAGHLIAVLLGRSIERVLHHGHDRLPTFGLLRGTPESQVRTWIDQLLVQGFIEEAQRDRYVLLALAPSGVALCRGDGTVRLSGVLPTAGKRSRSQRKVAVISDDPQVEARFQALRVLRKALAEERGVPPFVVFPDSTLRAIAESCPENREALAGVKGIGEHKLAHYGDQVLATLASPVL